MQRAYRHSVVYLEVDKMANFDIANTANLAQQGLNYFNSWDLTPASYNGVQFFLPKDSFNVINGITDLVSTAQQLFGSESGGMNSNLTSILTQIMDTTDKKLAIAPLLNSNVNIIQDNGIGIQRFNSIGMIQGENYLLQWQKINNMFLATYGDSNYDKIASDEWRVFNHPVRGKINNVYCLRVRFVHSAERYKALFFAFEFISGTSTQTDFKVNPLGLIQQSINNVIGSFNIVNNAFIQASNVISSITGSNNTQKSGIINTAPILNTAQTTTLPLAQATTQIIYQNFNPDTNNIYFNNLDLDYTALGVVNLSGDSIQNVQPLLQNLATNINSIISQIVTLGTDDVFNNVITALQQMMGAIYYYSKYVTYQNSLTFTIITIMGDTNLFSLLFNNGYDPNDATILKKFYNLNINVNYSTNYIPSGAIIKLPLV